MYTIHSFTLAIGVIKLQTEVKSMTKKENSVLVFLRDTIKISYEADKFDTLFDLIRILALAIAPLIHMYFLKKIVDGAVSGGNIISSFVGLILVMAYSRFASQLFSILSKRRSLLTNNYLTKLINKEFASVDYRYVEDQEIYNMVERLSKSQLMYFNMGFNSITSLLYTGVQFLYTFIILIGYLGITGLLLTFLIFISLIVAIWNGTRFHRRMKDFSSTKRSVEYLLQVLTNKEYANERAHFRFYKRLIDDYDKKLYEFQEAQFKGQFSSHFIMSISSVMILIFAGVTIFIMANKAVVGLMTVGEVVAVVYLFMQLSESIRWNILMGIYNITLAMGYHGDLNKLIKLEKTPGAMKERSYGSIDFDRIKISNLSFTYPTGDKKVLKEINLEFIKGRTYAIVGRNGSGKSTLVKVMSGLYSNYEGDIKIGNKNLKDMDLDELRNTYSIMYQDSARYPVTLKENILFGNIVLEEEKRYSNTIEKLGLGELINGLREKDNTILGKITEKATDLSGGQWQKVAMGRSIYNDSPIKIYDEPTAAMDPISESNFFESLHSISKGTTSIYITHRLASTIMADEIIVLDEGCVVEIGNHETLINKKGLYYNLYMDQRRWYEDGGSSEEAV